MADETEGLLPQSPQPDRNNCPKCAAPYRLGHRLLDTGTGKMVRVHQCTGCGESKWEM